MSNRLDTEQEFHHQNFFFYKKFEVEEIITIPRLELSIVAKGVLKKHHLQNTFQLEGLFDAQTALHLGNSLSCQKSIQLLPQEPTNLQISKRLIYDVSQIANS